MGYTASITTTQLCPSGVKAALDEWVWLCSNKTLFTKRGGNLDLAHGLQFTHSCYKGQLKLGQLSRVILAPELAVGPAGIGAELQGSVTSPSARSCYFPSFPTLGQFLRNIVHALLHVRVHFKGNPTCTPLNLGVVCYTTTDDTILNWVCL